MRNLIFVLMVCVVILGMAGCRSSHVLEDDAGNTPPLDWGGAIQIENEERMEPVTDSTSTGLAGSVTTKGLTAMLPSDPGSGGASAVPAQIPNERLLVRLIDPEDDILREVHPDIGGSFQLDYAGPVVETRMQVELVVAEDLNGDGEGMERIIQEVPLKLSLGYTAKVSMDMELVPGHTSPDTDPAFGGDLTPRAGSVLLVNITVQDATGYSENYYGVFFAEETTVYDEDDDHHLEFGDDTSGADVDLDGWIDPFEEYYELEYLEEPISLDGPVVDVNVSERLLVLQPDNSPRVEIIVPPEIGIEVWSDTDDGFIASEGLGPWLIGRYVHVDAFTVPDGIVAEWIIVDEAPPAIGFPQPPGF